MFKRNVCAAYLVVILSASLYHLLRWPVAAGDTDVWFHLNTGRYLWHHRGLPADTAFFSFVRPPRPLVDYSWLFQALLYALHAAFGYYGLIGLRTVLAAALLAAVGLLLFRGARRFPSWTASLAFALYAGILVPHARLIRPQLCTDLCIAVALGILEVRPDRAPWLPLTAWFWMNLHGIFYPVLLWISGAYLAEWLWRRGPGRERDPAPFPLLPVVASMACIYVTPNGLRLLPLPFEPGRYASLYIDEFRPLAASALSSLELHGGVLSPQGLLNAALILTLLSAAAAGFQRELKPRHLLLSLGGIILMTRGARFMHQGALLFLPLLADSLPRLAEELRPNQRAPALRVAAAFVLAVPPVSLGAAFARRPRYPVSEERLPRGVCAFLNAVEVGGRVLNHPNSGGYLEWRLSSAYRIWMDMRVPQTFSEDDFLAARGAFLDAGLLGRALSDYAPTFITVPLADAGFRDRISKFPEFVPVFFDDAEVLYVDRRRQPAMALAYGLSEIDPFEWVRGEDVLPGRGPRSEGREGDRGSGPRLEAAAGNPAFRKELSRLLEVDPHCLATRQLAAELALRDSNPARALSHARAVIEDFPQYPIGYRLEGKAREGLGQWREAASAFEAALNRADAATGKAVSRELGAVYLRHGRYARAYRAFRNSLDPSADAFDAAAVYPVALSAALAGRSGEADGLVRLLSETASRAPGPVPDWPRKLAQDAARLTNSPANPRNGRRREEKGDDAAGP